jgi:hypothetical protein
MAMAIVVAPLYLGFGRIITLTRGVLTPSLGAVIPGLKSIDFNYA